MATIYDVARKAGVSHTAVSAVINGNNGHRVGAEKQRRILEAIQELGYTPSRVAQQLATGRSHTIGVCFGSRFKHVFVHRTNSAIISAIGETFSELGYHLLIASTTVGAGLHEIIGDLPSQGVGGIIVVGAIPLDRPNLSAIDACEIPVVCIDAYTGFTKASTVDTDNVAAMAQGTSYLISQGHKRITYVGPPPTLQCFVDRMRGFCEGLQEHGMVVGANSTRIVERERVYDSLVELLGLKDRPTAIVCGEETYGGHAAEAIAARGLRIPEDVALVTTEKPPADGVDPQLVSVIRTAPYEMGLAAAGLLRDLLEGKATPPTNVRIPAQLDLRPAGITT